MYTKVNGEQQVQILSPNFSISPSNEDYVLNISANGRDFSPLFAVSAGVTRLVSNVAPGSYYKLVGNRSEVVINWQRMCATDGGGSGTELQPVADFPLNAVEGTVISYTGSSSASGVYQYDGNEWTEVGADDLSAYWTSAETQSAITAVEDHLFDVEQVTASALTELHDGLLEVSGRTVDMSDYWTSAETQDAINEKAAKYFTKEAPIIMLDQDNINAFFGENTIISLLDITNGIYNDNPFDLESSNYGDFTIDAANKLFYIENVPAGFYRIGVNANNVEDPTLTFKVLIDGEEIETNTTDNLPYAINGYMAILLNNGNTYDISNWTLEADAERITFKYDEENEVFDVEVVYKPTIDEVVSVYYTSAQTEDAISAATSGKADAANITGRNTGYYFPYYNEQGVITGDTQAYKANLTIHLSDGSTASANLFKDNNYGIPGIYVASTPGTAGQIAKSNGYGFTWANDDKVSSTYVSTIWKGTQTEYDTITESGITADPTTLYIII